MLAAGRKAREAVRADEAEEHRQRGAEERDHEAVADSRGVAVPEQYVIGIEVEAARVPPGRERIDLGRCLERDHEQPVDREHEDEREQDGGGQAQAEPQSPPLRERAHRASSTRRSRNITSAERRMITSSATAAA